MNDVGHEPGLENYWVPGNNPFDNSLILSVIFKNLSIKDLKQMRVVCKLWNEECVKLLNKLSKVRVKIADVQRPGLNGSVVDFVSMYKERLSLDFARLNVTEVVINFSKNKKPKDFETFVTAPFRNMLKFLTVKGLTVYEWNAIAGSFFSCFPMLKRLDIITEMNAETVIANEERTKTWLELSRGLNNSSPAESATGNQIEALAYTQRTSSKLDFQMFTLLPHLKELSLGFSRLSYLQSLNTELRKIENLPRITQLRFGTDAGKFLYREWSINGRYPGLGAHIASIINVLPLEKLAMDWDAPLSIVISILAEIRIRLQKLSLVLCLRGEPQYDELRYAFFRVIGYHCYDHVTELDLNIREDVLSRDDDFRWIPLVTHTPENLSVTTLRVSLLRPTENPKANIFLREWYAEIPIKFPNVRVLSISVRSASLLRTVLKSLISLRQLQRLNLLCADMVARPLKDKTLFGNPGARPGEYRGLLDLTELTDLYLAAPASPCLTSRNLVCGFTSMPMLEYLKITKQTLNHISVPELSCLSNLIKHFVLVDDYPWVNATTLVTAKAFYEKFCGYQDSYR